MRLLNYIKHAKNQSFFTRCWQSIGSKVGRIRLTEPMKEERANMEKIYFQNVMSDNLKYPACNFCGDPAFFEENTTNGLVLMLRDLARGRANESHDIPSIEHFNAYAFTLDEFLEIFYLLSIPEVTSRLTYGRDDLSKFLTRKYGLCRSNIGNNLDKHIIILHLLRKTKLSRSGIVFYVVDSIQKKFKLLSNTQMIEIFYFLHFDNKDLCSKDSKFEFHARLIKAICDFTLDEMAVIAYGFFRSKTFPSTRISSAICTRVEEEVENLNNVQATVFSKFFRLHGRFSNAAVIGRFMEKCIPMLDKFTLTTAVHVGSAGIGYGVGSPELLNRVVERATRDISSVRLKDLERLMLACLYSNVHMSEESEFVRALIDSFESKKDEIKQFPRSFLSLLQYLIMYKIYVEDRISYALSEEVLKSVQSNMQRSKLHELLFIDVSTEIERPSYQGNKLSERLRKRIASRHSAVINSSTGGPMFRYTVSITEALENVYGKCNCTMKRLLPHYATYHPVLCFNQNDEVQSLEGKLDKPAGTIIKAPDDGNRWLCFVIVRVHGHISDFSTPNLIIAAKLRHFKAVGYTPLMVSEYEWKGKSRNDQTDYLLRIVENALKKESD